MPFCITSAVQCPVDTKWCSSIQSNAHVLPFYTACNYTASCSTLQQYDTPQDSVHLNRYTRTDKLTVRQRYGRTDTHYTLICSHFLFLIWYALYLQLTWYPSRALARVNVYFILHLPAPCLQIRSIHMKSSKECCLLGQNTTCKFRVNPLYQATKWTLAVILVSDLFLKQIRL